MESHLRIWSRLFSARLANCTPAILSKSSVHRTSPSAWNDSLMVSPPNEAGERPIASNLKLIRLPSDGA